MVCCYDYIILLKKFGTLSVLAMVDITSQFPRFEMPKESV